MKKISSAVGKGGMNKTMDVATIQYLLNCVPKHAGGPSPELAVDGICGPLTSAAIEKFQMANRNLADRRVDPNGPTLKALQAYDPYPNQKMAACLGAKGLGAGAATQKAASQAILKAVGAAVAQAVAKSTTHPGVALAPEAAQGMAQIVKQATQAAAKALEAAIKQAGGLPVAPAGGGGLGLGKLAKQIAEIAAKTAETAAKQAKIPISFDGIKLPGGPELPPAIKGGTGGLAKIIESVAKVAAEAAAKSGGKLPSPVKLTGLDEVPGKVAGVIKQISDTTTAALDGIFKTLSKGLDSVAKKW
jgi:peptidoglycan hydrolase-like protein with peptidoglycan-binding domain